MGIGGFLSTGARLSASIIKTTGGGAIPALGSLFKAGGGSGLFGNIFRGVGSAAGYMGKTAKGIGKLAGTQGGLVIGSVAIGLSTAISRGTSGTGVTNARQNAYRYAHRNPYASAIKPVPQRIYGPGYQSAAAKYSLAQNQQMKQASRVQDSTEGLGLALYNTRHNGFL